MTQPDPREPGAEERVRDRMTMDYPVELTRRPDVETEPESEQP